MPDPGRLLNTLRRAVDTFRAVPGRTGKLVQLPEVEEILAAGDLHGNLEHFAKLIKSADLAGHPGRLLIVQELIHGTLCYPDGSDKSHQLLDLLAALACQFPGRVLFLLGNHELAQWTGRPVGKGEDACNERFVAGITNAYGARGNEIHAAYQELFDAAALVVRTANRIVLSHSVPDARQLSSFQASVLTRDRLRPEDTEPGGTAYSLTWGRDGREETVRGFLGMMDADLAINGHLPCEDGFDTPNPCQLVLDSHGAPASFCLFRGDRPLTLADLVAGIREL